MIEKEQKQRMIEVIAERMEKLATADVRNVLTVVNTMVEIQERRRANTDD